jgi:signal transduction histidine kinase
LRVEEPELTTAPVLGDPVLLERLAYNLVENAVRHNDSDGWLRVTTTAGPGGAVLAVSNSGPVIRPYDVRTMFEPFRRLDRERPAGERGFGLGLSIVRAITHAHGGDITATPHPNGGLTVTVTFPPHSSAM